MASSSGRNEFSCRSLIGGKILNTVPLLVEKVLTDHAYGGLATVAFMDNYFTLPSVMLELRKRKLAVVGTARPKPNWPPSNLQLATNSTFNDLYWGVDEFGTLNVRWVDNNNVLLVSTAHCPHERIERLRRKPRLTTTNRNHVNQVWGQEHRKLIEIPLIVDDYNLNMGGVDVADQIIANYTPLFRFHRTWMPLFIQCLSIIRINSYIIHRKSSTAPLSHKNFLLEFITELNRQALALEPSIRSVPSTTFYYLRKNPKLPLKRLEQPSEKHKVVLTQKQRNA